MDFVEYKCPCCGAALRFSGETQKLTCESCGNTYDVETLEELDRTGEESDLSWELQQGAEPAKKTADGKYICPSCGAQIEADENTVSTKCPYCDNVVVIKAAASGELKPEAIIPFQVEAKDAREKMEQFCKGKRLLPRSFRDKSYLKNLKGYYVPYWLFDCDAYADMSFDATKTRVWSDSRYHYTEISHYLVSRGGSISFYHVPVDGSTRMEDETTESIEPFHYKELVEFSPAYLAGYETDKYDVKSKDAEERAKQRLFCSTEEVIRSTVRGYGTVSVKHSQMSSKNGKATYVMLPVWLFETVYNKKKYQFAINGQTGKMVGELPVDKGAFMRYLLGFTALGTVILSVIGTLLFGGVL